MTVQGTPENGALAGIKVLELGQLIAGFSTSKKRRWLDRD